MAAAVEEPVIRAADASDDDSEGCDEGDMPDLPPSYLARARRSAVSAEAYCASMQVGDAWKPPKHAKDPGEREMLRDIIRRSHDGKIQMMFGSLANDTFEQVLDAMFCRQVPRGTHIIEQGGSGDFFYIVKTGHFDICVRKSGQEAKKVFEMGPGFAFGEMALLYTAPRTATITSTAESEVWCLARDAFRNLVVLSAERQFKEYVAFLQRCELFQELTEEQIASLAEVLYEEDFTEDEAILEQGERDDKMYILRDGEAVACIKGDQGEVEVMQYAKGDYFGEIALLLGEPRKASVYACNGKCTCLYVSRETFRRVLGPLHDILGAAISKYPKYGDAIKRAEDFVEDSAGGVKAPRVSGMEVFEGGRRVVTKMMHRKRERAVTEKIREGTDIHQPKESAEAEDKAPATLKEKLEQDYKNPTLVTPEEAFQSAKAKFAMFGGLRFPEKFTEDKTVVCPTRPPNKTEGLEDTYTFSYPSKLDGMTSMAVICQKGQKSAADPTPNQDNYFIRYVDNCALYGVFDGHGPFGHLVSFRLAQSVGHFLEKSPEFGKDFQKALTEAFLAGQEDLRSFCSANDINIEASGAAGSVLITEEQTLHIAHIGDARIMVGSYNRRDSRVVAATEDHKPQNEGEKQRLETAGMEVRQLDETSYRIYNPGTGYPGLTMSRAFGDSSCRGNIQEPEYQKILMQPSDEFYAVVASDGVWEFMEPEDVVNLTAKKLRLKGPTETVRFLTTASRKRWAHVCGDYCDDITAILVQFNAKKEGTDFNQMLTVTRHA